MPVFAQKSNAKKGGRDSNARRSRSRNTTPGVTRPVDMETPFLEVRMRPFSISSYDEIIEQQTGSGIPDSKSLDALMERIQNLLKEVEARGSASDRGMRMLAGLRKDRLEEVEAERRDEEQKERMKREAAEEEERGRKANKQKKRKDTSRARDERPLAHGAHGVAPQDGSNLEVPAKSPGKSASHKAHRHASRDPDSASSSLSPPVEQTSPVALGIMDIKAGSADADDSDSSDDHQPPPAATVTHVQTFGDDPSTFPDPTIYEILQVKPGMSDDEIKKIYSVADYPHDDLHDLIPGTPPDKDFSNAKPSNQVQSTTFATYLEPYFRPFTEEDLAFLRERGDRANAFVIPRRGKKHYTEVWAEEDGGMVIDPPKVDRDKLSANQARGSIEDLDDSIAETDQVSAGPILSRLLATLRPENRAPPSDDKAPANGVSNGDYSLNGDMNGDLHDSNPLAMEEPAPPIPPATFMPESSSESWKKSSHPKLDHAQVDERIKQELRHIGFLPFDEEPDFDGHFDDEIAARLRLLQAQLKEQAIINGAHKARMMDLVKERMAHQEYTTILEDLDGQVQSAYMKRTRSMGKSKKTKRPGGAGGGSHFVGAGSGMARPGIGDMTKTLMERRKKWIDNIGPVFGNEKSLGMVPRASDEGSSIFKPEDIAEYVKREREAWDEDVEEE